MRWIEGEVRAALQPLVGTNDAVRTSVENIGTAADLDLRHLGSRDIIESVAPRIDASQFNRRFPRTFPRFVQRAIWQYCSQQGRDICNGNQIDDRKRCANRECSLYSICDRKTLHKSINQSNKQ